MTSQMFEVSITATGEVRDADGNLLSNHDVAPITFTASEEQLRELGITPEEDDKT